METTKIEHEAQGDDRISQLVDDLVFHFLSHLDMKAAAQTSILSKRWKYAWTNWTDLDFDPLKIIPEYDIWEMPSEFMRPRYLNWVSQVVNVHHGPSVDHFRICFPFGASYSSHIDAWVKFAISKRVKKLELDFSSFVENYPSYVLGFDMLKHLPSDSGIGFLTSLHLRCVNVSGELLEFILLQCPLLQQLYVFYSQDLVSFKVVESSCKCKLKLLAVRYCHNLEKVEIHADSLAYFEYYNSFDGHDPNIEFKSVPSLVEATFGGKCCFNPLSLLQEIVCISELLSVVTLDLQVLDLLGDFGNIPSFCNVKHLTLRVSASRTYNLLLFTRFIEACPVLCELKLEVYWGIMEEEEAKASMLLEMDGEDIILDQLYNTYPSLKVLELVGFLGCDADVFLLLEVAHRAPNLKTIICDSHCYFREDSAEELYAFGVADMKETSRRRASKLAAGLLGFVSPGASIVII